MEYFQILKIHRGGAVSESENAPPVYFQHLKIHRHFNMILMVYFQNLNIHRRYIFGIWKFNVVYVNQKQLLFLMLMVMLMLM